MSDRPVLPEIPPAGKVIPQIGVGHHDGPGEEIAGQKQKEKDDYGYTIKSGTTYANQAPADYVFGNHPFPLQGDF